MNENRPNIVTIGIFCGAFSQLIVFAWNAVMTTAQMGPAEALALGTVLTGAVQYLDRLSKRQSHHVIVKYGDDE
jgi:hypothetical protein